MAAGLAPYVVVVSANAEWKAVRGIFPEAAYETTPWGETFVDPKTNAVFFHGGWGKVAAAGSTQYAIDRWKPRCLINLGTCGGFAGRIEQGTIVLVERTIIYDIQEAMGDPEQAIRDYSVELDLSWLGPTRHVVHRSLIVSGDRDLVPAEIASLAEKYGAVAGDWESGAIAYTCARNKQRLVILRGVSDLVSADTGNETYGNLHVYVSSTATIMKRLIDELPGWLDAFSLAVAPDQSGAEHSR